ncbi:DUF637 domain-containing protein, partial [Pseudomonas sp. MD195_PC81_125]
ANELTISAGRDFSNSGGVLKSGGDMYIDATRDINILAVAERSSDIKYRNTNETITQLGATIDVGRDLTLKSGRDIAVIASDITAKRDLSITATDNMLISSAADESHSYSKTKKVTRQEDHVSQVASIINAGGSITMNAGEDMTLVSSRIAAGDEAYLVAGGNLEVLAAQDSDYSLYDKKKKGSFGSSQTKRDEVTSILNIGTEISTGGKLTLLSGGDQRYQAAKLESGESLNLVSGGKITFEGVKDLHQESHEKSRNSMAWSSSKGRGTTDETLRQTELLASGGLVIDAVNGLDIDIKDVNQNTVSQTIDAMVKADPGLAWLKDAEKRGDVDWRLVKETHDSFKYSNSGMGPAAMLAVIIIVSVITAGAASTAVASVSGSLGATSATAMGSTMAAATATTAAGLGNIIASAVLTSMASTAAVSTINNKGNVGAAFHEVFSSESLKGYVLAGVTAGIAAKFGYVPTELQFDIPGVESVATKAVADALAKTAIMGGSLKDNLMVSALGSVVSIGGAITANKIGDITVFENGKLSKVVMHAALGGLMAEASGGDFRTGAIAAGANEALVDFLAENLLPKGLDSNSVEYRNGINKLMAASQLIGVLTAAFTNGDPSVAADVTANATQFNYLNHAEMQALANELATCKETNTCDGVSVKYFEKHLANDKVLKEVCAVDITGCQAALRDIYDATTGFMRGDYDVDLPPDLKKIVNSFHEFNLDASAEPTAQVAMPSIEKFIEAVGLDINNPIVKAAAQGAVSLIIAKKTGGMLGANGVKLAGSKTIWKGVGKERLDVENPDPGGRPGQLHYQGVDNVKYIYDPVTNTFVGAPKSVNKLLERPDFKKAVEKGMKKYLGEN